MKIAVIGAGIGGLTFAAALRQLSPESALEIFERDPSATSRSQGYSLGLKGDAGLPVLKSLELYDLLAQEVVTIQNFVFCDQRGRPLLELPATSDEARLTQRVKRQSLKSVLLGAVHDTPVHYGMACSGYRQNGHGIEVLFGENGSIQADYAIDGEGVGSPIRQAMIGDARLYLGLTSIVGDAPVKIDHPLLDGGYFLTLGDDGTSVFCYRQPEGIHLSYTVHAGSEDDLQAQPAADLLRRVQEATHAWHAPIPEVAAAISLESIVVRGYYDKEPPQRVRDGRVWMIGDAAHPMCPFQGQGANMAMLDGLKLAQLFASRAAVPADFEAKARELEADIVRRGRKAVLESRNAAQQFHTTGRLQQTFRNLGFRMGNAFIRMATKK